MGKISAMVAASVAALANEIEINESGTTKKLTLQQIVDLLQTLGMTRTRHLDNDHAISSTTGTEVTELSIPLEPGTYTFVYSLIVQSATATVGPMLGINFTGTHTRLNAHFRFADDSAALTAEVHEMDREGNKAFGFISGMATAAESTTAPTMGTTVGVSDINADILCFIEGIIVVTAAGDLELWHSSETATSTTVESGSSLAVTRTK